MANSADVIARRLYEAGCRHAFGIPGGEALDERQHLAAGDAEGVPAPGFVQAARDELRGRRHYDCAPARGRFM